MVFCNYIFVPGNKDVITKDHIYGMRDQAIVCNIGHFDNEIQVNALNDDSSVKRETIKPQVDRYKFPDGHEVFLLAEGRLAFLQPVKTLHVHQGTYIYQPEV